MGIQHSNDLLLPITTPYLIYYRLFNYYNYNTLGIMLELIITILMLINIVGFAKLDIISAYTCETDN